MAGGSSFNNKGAGSGGMIKLSYQKVIQSLNYTIFVNVSQGYQPNMDVTYLDSNGIFYGPLCSSGTARFYIDC